MRATEGESSRRGRALAAFVASLCILALLPVAAARQEREGAGATDCVGAACFEVGRVASCEGANCLEAVAVEGCEEAPCFALKQVAKCEGGSCFQLFRRPERDRPMLGMLGVRREPNPKATPTAPAAVQTIERRAECKTGACFELKQVKGCKAPPCFAVIRKEQCQGEGCFVVTKF